MNSKSQFGQDLHVLNVIYKNKKNGYFIEIGGLDGITDSNTYLLESEYNWKGIIVECNPKWYDSIIKNRKCIFFNNAAYSKDNEILPFYNTGDGIAGLVERNNHTHIVNWAPIINVTTKKLTTILDEAKAPKFIEFLSIDTEGSEYDILSNHDFKKYIFGYICVEHNFVESNRLKIRELLESKGYIFYRENKVDDDYIYFDIKNYI